MMCRSAVLLIGLPTLWLSGFQTGTIRAQDLTVPPDGLPADCRLEPEPASLEEKRLPLGLPRNPWWGTEPQLVARVQAMVVGAAPVVGSDRPAIPTTMAAEEAYAAFYASTEPGDRAAVFAVRFKDPTSVGLFPRVPTKLWQVGPFSVAISGPRRECWKAVMAHLAAEAKP
jgi:hypothetical protein